MFDYIKNFEKKFHLGYATIIIAVLTLASKITGFARDLLLASKLGLSREADIYFTAFRIPDLIYNLLILGTLSVAFIPVFTSYYIKDKEEAKKIAVSLFNLSILVVSGLALLAWLLLPYVGKFMAPGFTPEELDKTIVLTRWLLLSPIIFTASSVLSSTLLSVKKFIWVNAAPLFYNLGIIIGIYFVYPRYGLTGLVFGVLAGALLHFFVQLPQVLSLGIIWKPILQVKHKGVRQIVKLFIPRILGLDVSYVNLIIVSIVGSILPVGTIAAFNFANNIQTVPLGVFALSTAIAIFPVLSELYANKKHDEFIKMLYQSITRILYFIVPAAVYLLLLRAYLVRLLLGYGKCDWSCTITTFQTLGILSIALIAQSIIPILSRAFYARHNTKTPVIIGFVAIMVNIALSYLLSFGLGVTGITLGFLIASYLQLFLLSKWLWKEISDDLAKHKTDSDEVINFEQQLVNNISKIFLSCFIMGITAYGMLYVLVKFFDTDTVFGILVQTGISVLISGLIYLIITTKFKILQAAQIVAVFKKIGKYFNLTIIE